MKCTASRQRSLPAWAAAGPHGRACCPFRAGPPRRPALTTMDRSRRTESGRQPAITLVQPPDGMGPQPHGRCGTIVLSPLPTLARSRPTAILATAWPPRRSAGRARPQPQPNDTRPDRGRYWPAGLPRPPPASPAPGLTEPTAERLAERADAADTRRLGHPDGWTPDGWTMDAGHPDGWTGDG